MRKAIALSLICLGLSACGSSETTPNTGNVAANEATDPATADAGADPQALETSGLYPGSTAGIGKDRYVTSTSMDQVIAWYRDKEARRAQNLSFSTERHKEGFLIVGNDLESLKSFIIYLVPSAGGGTELRLYPFDYLAKGGKL